MSRLQIDLDRLELDDPETPHSVRDRWKPVAAIYQDYLQPDSVLSQHQAIELLADYHVRNNGEAWPVENLAFYFGEVIPYDDPAQTRLADLLLTFCKNTALYSKSPYLNGKPQPAELLYSFMDKNLRNKMHTPVERLAMGEKPMECVNAQAFSARLMSKDLVSAGLFVAPFEIAKAALSNAFELDHDDQMQELRDAWIMGAAQVIINKAAFIYSCVAKPGQPDYEAFIKQFHFWQSKKKTDALENRWPLTELEWDGWKRGFYSASCSDRYNPAC